MNNRRYITRYNGVKGTRKSFCGWRLCITRRKEIFVRYFTDRKFGSADAALNAALETREAMLRELSNYCAKLKVLGCFRFPAALDSGE